MYFAKLALAVVLCGGVTKTNETETRVRGEPHILFIGDPGTGKSQLLRIASKLITRSVFTTGFGSTAAGLTAAAIKVSTCRMSMFHIYLEPKPIVLMIYLKLLHIIGYGWLAFRSRCSSAGGWWYMLCG